MTWIMSEDDTLTNKVVIWSCLSRLLRDIVILRSETLDQLGWACNERSFDVNPHPTLYCVGKKVYIKFNSQSCNNARSTIRYCDHIKKLEANYETSRKQKQLIFVESAV